MYTILITKFDRSGQGSINFDDFIQCCIILQVWETAFMNHCPVQVLKEKQYYVPNRLLAACLSLENQEMRRGEGFKTRRDETRVWHARARLVPTLLVHTAFFASSFAEMNTRRTLREKTGSKWCKFQKNVHFKNYSPSLQNMSVFVKKYSILMAYNYRDPRGVAQLWSIVHEKQPRRVIIIIIYGMIRVESQNFL